MRGSAEPLEHHRHALPAADAHRLQADQAIRAGAPAKFAWYIAFGLMTTLVWLYIEILYLLSYLRAD